MLSEFSPDEEEAYLDELARRRIGAAQADTAGTVGEIPAALADAFARVGQAPAEASEAPEAPRAPVGRAAPRALPMLAPLPGAPDLTEARALDADARFRRGMEMAARQAIAGIGLQRAPTEADLVTQPGDFEARAVRDAAAARQRALDERGGQESDRAALLRQMAIEAGAERRAVDPELEREKLAVRREELGSLRNYREGSLDARAAETERRRLADAARGRGRGVGGAPKTKLAEGKAARQAAKDERERVEGLAAGWELTPDSNSTKRQREEHAGLVTSAKKMRGLTQAMRQQMQGIDTIDRLSPLSEKRNQLKQLATMISIEAKNIAELGALSGPDYALMQAIAADPTSLQSLTKDQLSVLDQLDRWSDNSVQAKSEAVGARPRQTAAQTTAGAAPDTAPSAGPRADGKVPMVSVAKGTTVFLSPAAAEKLEAEGKVRKP